MATAPQTFSISDYVDDIKDIYNALKQTMLASAGELTDANVSQFSVVLNRIVIYSYPPYATSSMLIRYMSRKSKYDFIDYLNASELQYLCLLTDGTIISKMLRVNDLVLIRWNASQSKFIVTPIRKSRSRRLQRSRGSQRSRGKNSQNPSRKRNNRRSGRGMSRTELPAPRVVSPVKFGRRTYLSAATAEPTTPIAFPPLPNPRTPLPQETSSETQPDEVSWNGDFTFTQKLDPNVDWADVEPDFD